MQSLLAGSGTPFLSFPAVVLISLPAVALISSSGCFPMVLRCSALASKSFPMAIRHGAAILFAMALTVSSSATAPRPAKASRWFSATVPPSSSPWHSRPAAPPRRPGQQKLPDGFPPRYRHPVRHSTPGQQLRHGALASKSFPMVFRHGAAILFAMALTASSSATAPWPATNLIRRRRVLRFG